MTPKAYALCQLPLSLCADVPHPSEKKIELFSGEGGGGGGGGVRTKATPS